MRCPSCRVETKLKSGTDLPKNFALLETLECSRSAPQKQAPTEICDACAEEIAEVGCVECTAKFCSKCWPTNHRIGALKSHQKVDISDIFIARCPKHPSKTADLVCLEPACESYETLICLLCEKMTAHKGHLTEPVEQVAEERRKQLKEAMITAQHQINLALRVLVDVGETETELSGVGQTKHDSDSPSNRDKAILEITLQFQELIANLESRRDVLIRQVNELVKLKGSVLEDQRVALSKFLARSYVQLQEATQLMNNFNVYSFMTSFPGVYSAMKDSASISLPSHPVVDPLVTVSFAASLIHEVQKFGEVIISSSSVTDSELTPQISEETTKSPESPSSASCQEPDSEISEDSAENPHSTHLFDTFGDADNDFEPFGFDPDGAARPDGFNNADIDWEHFDFDLGTATTPTPTPKQAVVAPAHPNRFRHPFRKHKPTAIDTRDQWSEEMVPVSWKMEPPISSFDLDHAFSDFQFDEEDQVDSK